MLVSMPIVFLSYRRADSRADAGRLYDRLSQEFGDDNVFMDVDDIAPGENFVTRLEATLGRCDVLVAVIGPQWASIADDEGKPRLHEPEDFLVLEIGTALKRGITLIPVLVGGARMPTESDLPGQLAPLARQQALSVRHERFRDDTNHLITAIRRATGAAKGKRTPRYRVLAAAAAVILLAVLTWWVIQPGGTETLRAQGAQLSVADARAMLVKRDFFTARTNAGSAGGRHDFEAAVFGGEVVVVDHVTGLMWQQAAFSPQRPIADARETVARTNKEGFAGFHDWRLPTLEEVTSLLTPDSRSGYHIDPVFDASAAPAMWTADTHPDGGSWVVWVGDASVVAESPGFNAWLRLVRSDR